MKINLAIVGAGMIATSVLDFINIIDTYKIKAICATKEEKLKQLATKYSIESIYTNYEAMLLDENIDTVYVAVPNHLHYDFTKKALEHNKHVICEKPFTSNKKELEELVELAKAKELILVEAIMNQHLENYESIKKDLPKLGNIKIVECNYSQYSSRYDAFKKGEIQPAFDYTKSGGALMDLNIYNIHFVVGLFGKPNEVHYYANIENNIDTSGILILEYPTFKCVCIGAKDCKAPLSNNIQGDGGNINITVPVSLISNYSLNLNNQESVVVNRDTKQHRMQAEFEAFAQMIIDKDIEKRDRCLEHSILVMDVVDKAKKDASIIFMADKEN